MILNRREGDLQLTVEINSNVSELGGEIKKGDKQVLFIVVTFWVFKLNKFKFVNELQPPNIAHILLTFLVLKFDKFKNVNRLQPQNI